MKLFFHLLTECSQDEKLNNFILFPLILGTTCLVCGGVVSAINYAVSGKIAENSSGKVAKTIKSVFVGSKEVKLVYDTTSDDPALNTNPKPFDSHIVQYYSVVTADEKQDMLIFLNLIKVIVEQLLF